MAALNRSSSEAISQSTRKAKGIMTDQPKEPERHELHISFESAAPKPAKVHPFRDVCFIVLACGLIATVFKSSALFGILSGIMIILYIIGGPKKPPDISK